MGAAVRATGAEWPVLHNPQGPQKVMTESCICQHIDHKVQAAAGDATETLCEEQHIFRVATNVQFTEQILLLHYEVYQLKIIH